jgi:hypothetical protein
MKSPEKDNKLPLQIYNNSYVPQATIGLQMVRHWFSIGNFETKFVIIYMSSPLFG